MADNKTNFLIALGMCALAGACSPGQETGIDGVDGFGAQDAGPGPGPVAADTDEDAGIAASDAGEPSPPDTPPLDAEPMAFGVVAGDRTVTSVSLLGPDASVLALDFVNSGSAPTGLVTALSGDVVLPTRSGDPGTLTLLDRYQTDVLTRIDPASGDVLGQVRTHGPPADDAPSAYASNPQDFVYIDEDSAWVSRFGPNLHVPEADADRGLDLLHIDPTTFERGERISLWHLNGEAERENPDTGERQTVPVYARPGNIVRIGDRALVIGISSLSLSFDAAGDGMVAFVDLETRRATGVPLPGLQNCGTVVPVPDDATRVIVACSGFYRGVPRDTAGVVLLHLMEGTLSVEHGWYGSEHPESPLAVGAPVSLGGTEVVVVATGARAVRGGDGGTLEPETHDVLYRLDLRDGSHMRVFEAAGRYVIGAGAFNPRRGLLLVPDGSVDGDGLPTAGVRTFTRSAGGDLDPGDLIEIDAALPVRSVRPL